MHCGGRCLAAWAEQGEGATFCFRVIEDGLEGELLDALAELRRRDVTADASKADSRVPEDVVEKGEAARVCCGLLTVGRDKRAKTGTRQYGHRPAQTVARDLAHMQTLSACRTTRFVFIDCKRTSAWRWQARQKETPGGNPRVLHSMRKPRAHLRAIPLALAGG